MAYPGSSRHVDWLSNDGRRRAATIRGRVVKGDEGREGELALARKAGESGEGESGDGRNLAEAEGVAGTWVRRCEKVAWSEGVHGGQVGRTATAGLLGVLMALGVALVVGEGWRNWVMGRKVAEIAQMVNAVPRQRCAIAARAEAFERKFRPPAVGGYWVLRYRGDWVGQVRRGFPACPSDETDPMVTVSRAGGSFVMIPAGEFTRGSPGSEPERREDEAQHTVAITRPFLMKTTEVTQREWRHLMATNPSRVGSCGGECPVENVNWWEALAYCNVLSRKEGVQECYELRGCDKSRPGEAMQCNEVSFVGLGCAGYRLPTESEWEYAARAGTTEASYGALDDVAWYGDNSGGTPHGVGRKAPNALGLYDMLGNVMEWCWDRYGKHGVGDARDPIGPPKGSTQVLRGGSWNNPASDVRAACRTISLPGYRYSNLGFRPVRTVH